MGNVGESEEEKERVGRDTEKRERAAHYQEGTRLELGVRRGAALDVFWRGLPTKVSGADDVVSVCVCACA